MDVSTIFYTIFSCLVLISDAIVIIVIVRSRELHLPTLWNIAHMAAWDFSLGLYFLVFVVPSKMVGHFAYSEALKAPVALLYVLITGQNFYNILVALVDRYISVCWPLYYIRLMCAKRFVTAIVCVTILNMIRVIVILVSSTMYYREDVGLCVPTQPTATRVFSSGTLALVFIAIVFLIVRLCLTLKQNGVSPIGAVGTRHRNKESSKFKVTIILSGSVSIICYLPWLILMTLSFVTAYQELNAVIQLGFITTLSNSLWNIFIYAATYKPFKEAIWRLFCPYIFREQRRRQLISELRQIVSVVGPRMEPVPVDSPSGPEVQQT